jgi:hypothetical protein
MNEVLEPITFFVAFPTVYTFYYVGSHKFTIYVHLAAGSYKHFL